MFPRQESDALEIGAGLTGELAEMAAILGELEVLAARVRGRGVDAVVLSRFSADPSADLLEQVDALDADVLLLPSGSPAAVEPCSPSSPSPRGLFDGAAVSSELPLSAMARNGQSGDSALALAVRLARGRHTSLQVVDDGRRRLGSLLERLGKAGVDTTSTDVVLGGVVVLAADGTAPPGADAVLRVRAHAQQDDSELVLLLDALPAQTRREPGEAPVGSG